MTVTTNDQWHRFAGFHQFPGKSLVAIHLNPIAITAIVIAIVAQYNNHICASGLDGVIVVDD